MKNKAINNSKKISKTIRKLYYSTQLSCRQTLQSHNNVKILNKKVNSNYIGRIKKRRVLGYAEYLRNSSIAYFL